MCTAMQANKLGFLVILCLLSSLLDSAHSASKYRICVVGANKTKSKTKSCLAFKEDESSMVECVDGSDRLDCLVKISEGKADFGVFEAEDVVMAAHTKNNEILVTNEIRFYEDSEFEYEVVAIVRNGAHINRLADLQGKNLCHPGYGYELKWSELISRYFEARVVPQLCNNSMTLTENRIKSASTFFNAACKAGPWVPDYNLDSKLKNKYPNLCELCDNPMTCSSRDKYWGRRGPLYCLTDGFGDVAWVRLDDAKTHFGLSGMPAIIQPSFFSFLCPDGNTMPLTSPKACTWLARPWATIGASKVAASNVQTILAQLKNLKAKGWEWALDRLIAPTSQDTIAPLPVMQTPEDFLTKANGFTSANSLSDCTTAQPIRICTRSGLEQVKCSWMKEAAMTYGIEPKISCLRAKSVEDCMKVVQGNAADVVITGADQQVSAHRDYGLKALLYEFSTNTDNLYNAAAVVRTNSAYKRLEDLRGRKACFPSYEGVSWTSLIEVMKNNSLLPQKCPYTKAIGEYFHSSCVPGLSNTSKDFQPSLQKLCSDGPVDSLIITKDGDNISGEMGAFHCLATGVGDVAFINLATIANNTDGANAASWAYNLKSKDYRPLCLGNSTSKCYLSWATQGQIMVKSNTPNLRAEEMFITFLHLDHLFGKREKTQTPAFQLFGEFNGQNNVMFQDSTHHLEDYETIQHSPQTRNYEKIIRTIPVCAGGPSIIISTTALILTSFLYLITV